MYLGTFSRRARSLATILIFARVRILGTQCLFVIATVTKVSRKRGLWLVVRVKNCQTGIDRFPSGSKFTLIEQIYKECGKRLDPGKEHQVDNKQNVERYCFFDECRGLTLCNRAGYEHQGSHRR